MTQKRTAMQMMADAVRLLAQSPSDDNELDRLKLRREIAKYLEVVDPTHELRRAR